MYIDKKEFILKNGQIILLQSAREKNAEALCHQRYITSSESYFMVRYPEESSLDVALEQDKKNGFEQVELGVFEDNLGAIHLYEKCRFEKVGIQPRAFKLKGGTY